MSSEQPLKSVYRSASISLRKADLARQNEDQDEELYQLNQFAKTVRLTLQTHRLWERRKDDKDGQAPGDGCEGTRARGHAVHATGRGPAPALGLRPVGPRGCGDQAAVRAGVRRGEGRGSLARRDEGRAASTESREQQGELPRGEPRARTPGGSRPGAREATAASPSPAATVRVHPGTRQG